PDILDLLPDITHLTLTGIAMNCLINYLDPFRLLSTSVPLRYLTHFDLSVRLTTENFDVQRFLETVQLRWDPVAGTVARLKLVKLSLSSQYFNLASVPALVTLQKAGLAITVKDKDGFVL